MSDNIHNFDVNESVESVESSPKLYAHGHPKPLLRGWLHGSCFLGWLIYQIKNIKSWQWRRFPTGKNIYSICLANVFMASSLYHIPKWDENLEPILQAYDHASIAALVASSYTNYHTHPALVGAHWVGASAVISQCYKNRGGVPLWMHIAIQAPGIWIDWKPIMILALTLHLVGTIIYKFKFGDWWPGIWGHHEWFHLFTIVGSAMLLFDP